MAAVRAEQLRVQDCQGHSQPSRHEEISPERQYQGRQGIIGGQIATEPDTTPQKSAGWGTYVRQTAGRSVTIVADSVTQRRIGR